MRCIRVLTSFATLDNTYQAGEEYDVPDDVDYVSAGLAEYVELSSSAPSPSSPAAPAPDETEPSARPHPRRRR